MTIEQEHKENPEEKTTQCSVSDHTSESEPLSQQELEPTPTDFRRNIWLLVVILAAVAAAWIVSRMTGSKVQEAKQPPAAPAQAQQQVRPEEPAKPLSYAEKLERQRLAARLSVFQVIGSERRFAQASPAIRRPPDPAIQAARLFDVTSVMPGVSLEDLYVLQYADERPLLGQPPEARPQFAAAKDIDFLGPDDRVIVLSTGAEVHAYPVRILAIHAAMVDTVGGRRVLVCWSVLTQLARCFVLPGEDGQDAWGNSGRLYKGNAAFYDARSGSLWDGYSGLALTGPKAGQRLERLPVTVNPWPQWRESNPEAEVLTMQTGHTEFREAGAYGENSLRGEQLYLAGKELPLAVPGYSPDSSDPVGAKAFVIGLEVGGKPKAYPIENMLRAGGKTIEDQLDGQKVRLTVTSPRTAYAADPEGRLLDAAVMLWFGWKSAHPDTQLWRSGRDQEPVEKGDSSLRSE